MLKPRSIHAQLIEMMCDHCNKGMFRFDTARPVLSKPNLQYPHRCSHCRQEVYIAKRYPLIAYGNEEWVLNKYLVRPSTIKTE
ncbi:hypothetical protein MACH09_47150 [Vibrio sp. MACH09]|nr:hypothetical protein MACH09_47150 [Vibrio sp. MACH09]